MSWLRDIHMCRDKRARMLLTQKTKRNINVWRKHHHRCPSLAVFQRQGWYIYLYKYCAYVLVPIQEYPTYILLTVERLILILYLWSKFNADFCPLHWTQLSYRIRICEMPRYLHILSKYMLVFMKFTMVTMSMSSGSYCNRWTCTE
jgi:hypothetical protein